MDIVERLMCYKQTDVDDFELINPDGPEAADEIERLRSMTKVNLEAFQNNVAEIERLREALQKIVKEAEISIDEEHAFNGLLAAEYIARSALQQKESK
jgi:succinate dehydrogenase/fumarate reductase flavoprotein subunit